MSYDPLKQGPADPGRAVQYTPPTAAQGPSAYPNFPGGYQLPDAPPLPPPPPPGAPSQGPEGEDSEKGDEDYGPASIPVEHLNVSRSRSTT